LRAERRVVGRGRKLRDATVDIVTGAELMKVKPKKKRAEVVCD
jgi:hypothetical protein